MNIWQRRVLIVVVPLLVTCGAARATTGNELLRLYEQDRSWALNFVVGVLEGQSATIDLLGYATTNDGIKGAIDSAYQSSAPCVPRGVTNGQVSDVVRKWLSDNPALRHLPAAMLVITAAKRAWPCPATAE